MRLLLDTHVVLWWLDDPGRLSDRARKAINSRETFVSAVTGCEIGQKSAVGKLRVPDDLEEQIEDNEFLLLPISVRHGLMTSSLPLHHKDPFDRLLVAQARCEGLTLVTADARIAEYDVLVLAATE